MPVPLMVERFIVPKLWWWLPTLPDGLTEPASLELEPACSAKLACVAKALNTIVANR